MESEKQFLSEITEEKSHVPHEPVPAAFPIQEDKETYYGEDTPKLTENIITHYYKRAFNGEKLDYFMLLRVIDGLHYEFRFNKSFGGAWGVSFKTEEYEYARTSLSKEGQEELTETLTSFIESIASHGNVSVNEIRISPADASYTAQEIEECTDAILASPENTLSREELAESYKGYQVFDLYEELFGKDFQGTHYNRKSNAGARSRYFKSMFKKHMPNWEIDDSYFGHDFRLKPKERDSLQDKEIH